MTRKILVIVSLLIVALAAVGAASAAPGQPNFAPALYADGEVYGTKFTTVLPAPNDNNMQSFDKLFAIINSNNPAGQMPVAEAAPGNPAYNGGRWAVQTVEWTEEGFAHHGTVPVLTSYDDVMLHAGLGHLTITPGSPEGGPPDFFQCPLLPVK